MLPKAVLVQVQEACEDLKNRTLTSLPGSFGRLIYLASMRDYNTGLYYHEGLANRFSGEAAAEALAKCHRAEFHVLLKAPLAGLVAEIEQYIRSSPTEADKLLETWEKLQPYRVTVPAESNSVLAEFFASNVKIALSIVKHRRMKSSQNPPLASQPH